MTLRPKFAPKYNGIDIKHALIALNTSPKTTVLPYENSSAGKKEQVAQMFNSISGKYDFLNHFLSGGLDMYWRKRAIKALGKGGFRPQTILDVATGTGDLALEALVLKPNKIIGVDIADGMLDIGRKKMLKRKLDHVIELQLGDSERLAFPDNTFDAVMVSFGVRNFENLQAGINDIYRVLKPGGRLMVLEFSKPTLFPFKQLYHFYFNNILPFIGRMVSKDNSAYTYLPNSVKAFPDGEQFLVVLTNSQFKSAICTPLTIGISSIYTAEK